MKKILIVLLMLAGICGGASAQSLGDIFGRLGGSTSGNSENTEESTGSSLGSALGSMLGTLTSTNKFAAEDLIGTWNYSSPAVGFASDNALKKIGGAAASTALENKLEPYYQKAGLTSVTMTVDEQLNFTLTIKKLSLKGTISKDEDNNLVFNFSAMGKIKLGSMAAMATKSGSTLTIVFDATKLMKVLNAVSSVAKLQSLSALNSLLQQYDGLYLGFKMSSKK
ncbi:MAG: DUF4923 family protein [Muribaculaceae bacterium]|nr:DUF4923 family protein [Muribaculaceae bacterium]